MNINGSFGEGGGQILRTAISLSVLTKKNVSITNIRANRPNPGIKPQHYAMLDIIKKICNAKIDGLEIGSSNLKFSPGTIKCGDYFFDIGTAGSITLVFQACILSLIGIKEPVKIRLKGGTDVKWSPSWDYFNYVFIPLINKMNISVNAKLLKRGYYPKGGGEAEIIINPNRYIESLKLDKIQKFKFINGKIHLSNLPDNIGTRMKNATIKILLKNNLKYSFNIEKVISNSPGIGITLWTKNENAILGATIIGEKGVPAEKIGEEIAIKILREIKANSTLDIHAFDQLIPYMVLSEFNKQSSCIIREISSHASTNMWLIGQFFKNQKIFNIENTTNNKIIKINGLGIPRT